MNILPYYIHVPTQVVTFQTYNEDIPSEATCNFSFLLALTAFLVAIFFLGFILGVFSLFSELLFGLFLILLLILPVFSFSFPIFHNFINVKMYPQNHHVHNHVTHR